MTTMKQFREVTQIMDRLFPEPVYQDVDEPFALIEQSQGTGCAVLAGGFLRDLILYNPYNDVDVMSNMDPVGVVMTPLHEDDPRYVHNDIDAVGYALVDGYPFNFIKLRQPTNVEDTLNRIDFGLCRVAWSRKAGLVISNEFLLDAANKTITNYRTGWGETGVNAHYKRLYGRYPYPLVHAGEKA